MHKHTIDLLKRLLVATEEERLKWQEVPGKTAFSYLAGEYVVLVDAKQASFRLTDSKGRSLEQADKEALSAADLGTGILAIDAIERICAIARRQALGTDEAIAAVMQHLENLGEVNDEAETEVGNPPAGSSNDEPPFLEELAARVEEGHPAEPEPEPASDLVENKEKSMDNVQYEEALLPGRQDVGAPPPKKKKKRKRSRFSLFGRKKG
ncbi:MAG: hypothetical protein Q9M33_08260 [Robiginitomaculum sp.]|nr:hypothetical protein [Robiginitomaculum sp.]MDQ7077963.1 hypothetical protein [Robiginitomaculum sp.]